MKHLSSISIFLFIFIGCSLFDDDAPKDPRDYTWTLDTLKHPDPTNGQILTRMWASSSDDIYIVGHSSSGFGTMWHYNGDAWSPVPITKMNGGPIENKHHGIKDIFGFSKDNIWAVGYKGGKKRKYDAFVIHYDGWKWREITPPDTSELMSVGGGDNGEIWVGPWGGGVFKYNGEQWIDTPMNILGVHGNTSYAYSFTYHKNYLAYMRYVNKEYNPRYISNDELYKYNGKSWDLIVDENDYYIGRPWISDWGTVFLGGEKILKIEGDKVNLFYEFPGKYGVSKFDGIGDNFIFGSVIFPNENSSNIVFYDGNEWMLLLDENIKNIHLEDIWTDGKTVVAIGNYNSNTFVLRGE